MQIEAVLARQISPIGRERIDRADAGRAERGDDAGRHEALRAVVADRGLEQVGAHREVVVGRDQAQARAAEARDLDGLLDRGVGLLGCVEA